MNKKNLSETDICDKFITPDGDPVQIYEPKPDEPVNPPEPSDTSTPVRAEPVEAGFASDNEPNEWLRASKTDDPYGRRNRQAFY